MAEKVRPPRLLILFTLLVLIGIACGTVTYQDMALPLAIEIATTEQPTIGNPDAKVHLVVFEEPKCPDCARYNNEIYPTLKKEFIDTRIIQYTVIPVSFLPDSMPAAEALLCVYFQDPQQPNGDLFITYLDYIYQNQPPEGENWVNSETLSAMAKKASPQIDTEKLNNCIDGENYQDIIEENTKYGRGIMDGRLMVPTVYVNGMKVETISVESITDLINKAQKQKDQ